MYRAIRSMYDVVKARFRVGGDLTDTFMRPRGLKQSEIFSPNFFLSSSMNLPMKLYKMVNMV